ncbi:histidine phosphatase family protein [Sphingobacterium humi]|uniref:Histidine phosphatase family protein n=1 Tax=Sphingobacterium humi TaxID=1796905 RepID=A0A6N8L4T3_9SPHI|nr:histidine phosphatase family protein [Sphingobacterium humi]MVZ64124.1 histidine phosphatase family protein [Sphingobacterium humi]
MKNTTIKSKILPYLFLITFLSIGDIASAQNKTNKQATDNTVIFYFARHGKTILNTMDRVQGWADSPLTPEGVLGAEDLGRGLKQENIQFKSAYSSDLGRATQTTRLVLDQSGNKNLSFKEMPELRETNFGSYEGDLNSKMWNDAALYLHFKSAKELFEELPKNPSLIKDMLASFKTLETLGIGEDYDDVKSRGQRSIREIAEREAKAGGGNILVVGHGMALSIFLSDLDSQGKKAQIGHMGNAAISKVIYKDGKFTLESFGDMSYVEKGKTERLGK